MASVRAESVFPVWFGWSREELSKSLDRMPLSWSFGCREQVSIWGSFDLCRLVFPNCWHLQFQVWGSMRQKENSPPCRSLGLEIPHWSSFFFSLLETFCVFSRTVLYIRPRAFCCSLEVVNKRWYCCYFTGNGTRMLKKYEKMINTISNQKSAN